MDISHLSKLTAKLRELNKAINEIVGTEHDMVIVLHARHEKGECKGSAVITELDNTKVHSMLYQSMLLIEHQIVQEIPPASQLN